jgi:hypothetical protein
VRALQSSAVVSGMSAPDLLALSGALAGINPENREMARSALIRIFGKEGGPGGQSRAALMGLAQRGGVSAGQFDKMRTSSPGAFLAAVGGGLAGLSDEQRAAALSGIANTRDVVLLTELASALGDFSENTREANKQVVDANYLQEQYGIYADSARGKIDAVSSAFSNLGYVLADKLGPALSSILEVAAGLVNAIGSSSGLVAGGAGVLGMSMFKGGRRLMGKGMAAFANRSAVGESMYMAKAVGSGVGFTGKTAMGRGAGFLSGIFGRGISSTVIEGAEMAGMRGLASRAGLMAAGPVGWIVTAMSVLEPVFGGLANMLDHISKKGGVIGAVASSLEITFRILELGGTIINKVFDVLWGGIKKIGQFLHLDDLFNFGAKTGSGFADFIHSGTTALKGGNHVTIVAGSQAAAEQAVVAATSRAGSGMKNAYVLPGG